MDISIKDNTKQVLKEIGYIPKKQIPFATAVALTKTAQSAQKALTKNLKSDIDRPTKYTTDSIGISWAKKSNLTSAVFIKDKQSGYLKFAIEGGTRKPKKRAIVQPGAIKLNQYGNLPKNAIKRIMARRNTFSGSLGGVPGIYERTRKGTKLLIAFVNEQSYEGGQFKFYEIAKRTIDKTFNNHMKIALVRAMRTAK